MLSKGRMVGTFLLVLLVIAATSICEAADREAMALTKAPQVPLFSHVAVVVEENHAFRQIVGARDMPYLNSLIASYGLATSYYANAHPSIPNYFMLTTGRAITKNDSFTKVVRANNVVRVFKHNNISWKAYIENLPANPTRNAFPYLRSRNPFSFFADVLNDPGEQANLVDFSQLARDMAENSLPEYSFIVPNAYHQGHSPDRTGGLCADPSELAETDCWLQDEIDPLVSYLDARNGLLIITWDEGTDKKHGGGQVATVVVSSLSVPGFKAMSFFQHQSTLRLMLQVLGLTKFPGAAAQAPEMGAFFNF